MITDDEIKAVAFAICRAIGIDPLGSPRRGNQGEGYGLNWHAYEVEARAAITALDKLRATREARD